MSDRQITISEEERDRLRLLLDSLIAYTTNTADPNAKPLSAPLSWQQRGDLEALVARYDAATPTPKSERCGGNGKLRAPNSRNEPTPAYDPCPGCEDCRDWTPSELARASSHDPTPPPDTEVKTYTEREAEILADPERRERIERGTKELLEGQEPRRWVLDRCPDCSDSENTHPFDPPVPVVEESALTTERERRREAEAELNRTEAARRAYEKERDWLESVIAHIPRHVWDQARSLTTTDEEDE